MQELKNKVFTSNRFSRSNLLVFALIFAAVGGYAVYKSFAATTLHATPANFSSVFSSAQGGDTVLLASGNYSTFNGGAKASMVVIAPESGASISMDGGNFGSTVRNITIQGVTWTAPVCVSPGSTPLNLIFDSNTWGDVGQGCGEGRLTIRGGGGNAVGSNGVQIKNSTFGPGGCSDGIQDDSNGTEIGPNNEFKGIVQSCPAGSAHVDSIQPYGSNYVWIHDNYFHDNEQGIMSPDGPSTGYRIENNVIHTSTGYPCMHIGHSLNGSIKHNVCRNGGIRVFGGNEGINSQNMVVQNNISTGDDTSACSGCTIDHNLTTTQVTFTGGSGRCAYATASPKGTASDGTNIGLNDCSGGTNPPPAPPPPPPSSDTNPPTVSMTSPTSGSTVSGTSVTVSANASDNVGVGSVQFRLDGANLGTQDTSAPYSITWNTTTTISGNHTLSAIAKDAAGNSTTSSNVSVAVSNTSPPPVSPPPGCSPSTSSWQNNSIATQTNNFTFDFDAIPGGSNIDSVTGLSNGAATAYSSLAAAVRFNSSGAIDALNGSIAGGNYTAVVSIPYSAGTSYHFKLTVNPIAHTYSVDVTPAGGAKAALATNYPFRSEQATLSTLNNWATYSLSGSHSVCNAVAATVNTDTTAPTVSITSPTNGQTGLSGNVTIAANASDNVGIAKVEIYIDGALLASDTTNPYTAVWNASAASNGTHVITAKAYDTAGNTANSSSVSVTVSNADTTRPSTPTGLTGTAVSATRINLAWTASTDNVGVTGYRVLRGGAVIATVNTQSYSDTTVAAGATYSYSVVALDGAGNASSASAAVSVTTPSATDTTPPPAPTGLTATVVSANQINLKWAASTDSSGIKGYNVYRNGTKITATLVTTTSYGDAIASAGTSYSYTVTAVDGANNESAKSAAATATTILSIWSNTVVPGTVTDPDTNAVELGVKFKSDTATTAIGVRFYKGSSNTGTHIGSLWSSSGTRLASVSFTNETASGWQNANFSTPVSLSANTTYIVSYFALVGHYAADIDYFYSTGVNSGNLHALKNGTNGGNGVYRYGTTSRFPTQTYNASNYWVDVITR
jgi:fibronectin type 3 domain-containing protein